MRIIIDILHPAHVHFFKNFVWEMEKRGHKILITARDKDITLRLLDAYGFRYVIISRMRKGKFGLLHEFITRNRRFYKICKRFKPDVLLGIMGPTISVVGKILKIPAIVFYDTEHAKITNRFVYPLATCICTPSCYIGKEKKQFRYNGYHELAYLHPKRFKPDKNITKQIQLEQLKHSYQMKQSNKSKPTE